ncbi:RNA methyltransferase [Lutibaculum baratangense]|uniref:tRNA (cytidine/uridine-2'-O-)-methyltransferase TrmJ n=1 Tax=Lutibaculum baratangense AMV1 TaxID=631454 RepID=V4RNF9_9HYPH|nr:RNA methyltransferase [Lutibaculum baratangense]ESR26814.1 tRNA:Cm32/Um32 methyltransferase [Lutibaculum baratangense AMV1]
MSETERVVVILVKPQLGENIGMVARAMANFGLTELRLVEPRDGWPSEKARASASGADWVIDGARLYDTAEEAVADLGIVYATTARPREMSKPILTPHEAAVALSDRLASGEKAGLMFGGERSGLDNDDVALCDAIIQIPTNPDFASLNLAQSVLLLGYEFFRQTNERGGRPRKAELPPVAAKADMMRLFEHLEGELDEAGFLFPPEKRPVMVRNLRTIFLKAGLTDQEVRSLRGVIRALSTRRQGGGQGNG